METTTPEQNEHNEAVNTTTARQMVKRYERVCQLCKKEYKTPIANSKFCSDLCRGRAHREKKFNQQIDISETSPNMNTPSALPTVKPVFTGLAPHMQIAVDLLQKEATRWEEAFKKESAAHEKTKAELIKLKEDILRKEHEQTLQGIEDAKPGMFENILNGINQLPAPILEQIAPVLGRLANAFVPQQLGMGGQLDDNTQGLVNWLQTLPEDLRTHVMVLVASLSQLPPAELTQKLSQIKNLFTHGTTITNNTMWGT